MCYEIKYHPNKMCKNGLLVHSESLYQHIYKVKFSPTRGIITMHMQYDIMNIRPTECQIVDCSA